MDGGLENFDSVTINVSYHSGFAIGNFRHDAPKESRSILAIRKEIKIAGKVTA